MAERHSRILAELSELALVLARDLQVRAVAAQTAAEAAELGLAFHRISRSVRQSLALEARLERDRHRRDREDRAEAARDTEVRGERRRNQVRVVVERAIWSEAEEDEAEVLVDHLDDLLQRDGFSESFTHEAVEAQIARLRTELGLPAQPPVPADDAPVSHPVAEAALRPADAERLADPGWRSSA